MSYYSKLGNIVTVKTETKAGIIVKLITGFAFGILLGILGMFMLCKLILFALYTTDKFGLTGNLLTSLFVLLLFLISFSNLPSFFESFKKMIYTKNVKLDIETKKFFINDSSRKLNKMISFEDFERIEHNMVFVHRGNDENGEPNINYYLKVTATAKQAIVYFSDRNSYFDLLDLQYISNHLGIAITKITTEMKFKEYKEFRKKELEDRKLETREMYFL